MDHHCRNPRSNKIRKNTCQISIDALIQGYTQWLICETRQGRDPYYVNIVFHPLRGSTHGVLIAQMQKAIYNHLYPTLYADSALGTLIERVKSIYCHAHGCSLTCRRGKGIERAIRAWHLIKVCISMVEHLNRYQRLYVDSICDRKREYQHGGIMRVHAEQITFTPHWVTDYAMKTIKPGRVDYDATVILPRLASEMKSNAF
jgi:hypothetical protein